MTPRRTCECMRCHKCRDRERARLRARMIREGTWQPWTPADTVTAHIRRLLAAGMNRNQIATTAGVAFSQIMRLADGDVERCYTHTAEAILEVTTADARERGVNPVGTQRRLRALATLGWRGSDIAAHIGVHVKQVDRWRSAEHPRIKAESAAKVRAAYDDLSMSLGPSRQLAEWARNRGWASPLAWDDHEIDDPAASPHNPKDHGGYGRRLPEAERLVAEVNDAGTATVAARYGVSRGTVQTALRRAGYRAGRTGEQRPTYRKDVAA